jgi:hypothetical protein
MADNNQFTPGSGSRGGPGSVRKRDTGGIDPGQIIENAKNVGSQVVGAVQESATSVLDEQKKRAADQIATVADIVRNSVQSLDRQSAGTVRQYADDTARQISDFADRLRTRSWGELAGDVEDFARRWPAVFIASVIATGFIAGRFLVSSGSRASEAPAPMAQTTRPMGGMADQPGGGARYDYGAVSGPVSGSGNSGYGSGRKETP